VATYIRHKIFFFNATIGCFYIVGSDVYLSSAHRTHCCVVLLFAATYIRHKTTFLNATIGCFYIVGSDVFLNSAPRTHCRVVLLFAATYIRHKTTFWNATIGCFYIVGSDVYINSAHRTHCRVSVALWLRGRAILLRHMCIAYLVFCSYIAALAILSSFIRRL
jgi:hypothetical protein